MKNQFPIIKLLIVYISFFFLTACSSTPEAPSSSLALGGKPNFNGIWELYSKDKVVRPGGSNPPYTAEAKKILAEYNSWDPTIDDPALYCGLKGMPWMMVSRSRNYPTEIYHTPERLNLFFEFLDTSRVVYINGAPAPKDFAPSINGYSSAVWENDVLVIKTTALAERLYPSPELRSEKAEITERWALVKDPQKGDLLEIDIDIVDPVVYSNPIKAKQVFKRSAPGITRTSYNCPEKLWLKHVDDRRAKDKSKAK